MPCDRIAIEKHLKQALINEKLAKSIASQKGSVYFNWTYVALFYSAMHYFGAFLESTEEHLPKFHDGNDGAINLAKNKFNFITDSGKSFSAGPQYKWLFDYRHTVCYKPMYTEHFPRDISLAFKELARIKYVTFFKSGLKVRMSQSKRFIVETITESELENLKNEF